MTAGEQRPAPKMTRTLSLAGLIIKVDDTTYSDLHEIAIDRTGEGEAARQRIKEKLESFQHRTIERAENIDEP